MAAAASLGQVYKGKLRANGKSVAVKVQRPFVLETVSLDLYLMRQLGLNLRKVSMPDIHFTLYRPLAFEISCIDSTVSYSLYHELDSHSRPAACVLCCGNRCHSSRTAPTWWR